MKTPQIMQRDLNGFSVRQNHKTGMFNANDLLDAYKNFNPKSNKKIEKYLGTKTTKEYVNVILSREESQNTNYPQNGGFKKDDDLAIENLNDVIITKRGRHGGTWMHPYLFLDFAMWLSPEFKFECMKWLHDKLIQFRDQVGDTYVNVSNALKLYAGRELRHIEYIREANMINELVFGTSKGGQRNMASEEQLELLNKLQVADIKLIERGNTFEQRKKALTAFKLLLGK